MKKFVAMRRWMPWLGFALFGVAACEVVVGETDLTTVHCQAEGAVGPPACAPGQMCRSGVCVSGSSGSDGGAGASGTGGTGGIGGTSGGGTGGTGGTAGNPEAGDDTGVDAPDDGIPPEVGPDVPTDTPIDVPQDVVEEPPPTAKALGEACAVDTECNSGHCFQVPNKSNKVCSKFCCGSSECTLVGGVCVAYGGANVCFAASQLDLVLGSKSVGEQCNNGVECASGRCSGTCIDSCCNSASSCNCALTSYAGEVNWYCGGPSGSTGNLGSCTNSDQCVSNNCESFSNVVTFIVASQKCGGPCCSDADCPSGGNCEYVMQGSNAVRQCTPPSTSRPSDHRPCCGDSSCSGACVYVEERGFSSSYSLISTVDIPGFRCL